MNTIKMPERAFLFLNSGLPAIITASIQKSSEVSMTKRIGLLTAGSDCAGMNAAIRGIGKAVSADKKLELIGFRDGFNGLVEDRTMDLGGGVLSGILTLG
jgi:hypothetical protein